MGGFDPVIEINPQVQTDIIQRQETSEWKKKKKHGSVYCQHPVYLSWYLDFSKRSYRYTIITRDWTQGVVLVGLHSVGTDNKDLQNSRRVTETVLKHEKIQDDPL